MDVDDEQVVTGGGDGSVRQWKIGDQQKTSGGFINMLVRVFTLLLLHEIFEAIIPRNIISYTPATIWRMEIVFPVKYHSKLQIEFNAITQYFESNWHGVVESMVSLPY